MAKLPFNDLQNLPECAGEFIRLVIKKMRYRKKVRADVMAELIAHFEDELVGCDTAEEKEKRAQQLIEDFGEAKLLGILCRRAKKRCRPLWRTIVARGFQAFGILILCLIVYVAWFLSGKPSITTDYLAEFNRIVRPTADDSLNAAPFYHEAARAYEKIPSDIYELLGKKYYEATEEEKEIIKKWLADNKETLDLVIAGTKKPYYWQEYETGGNNLKELISIMMPHLSEFRKLTYSLRCRAGLSAEQGRFDDAFDDIKTCYRLGRHLEGDGTLIEQLVGIAIRAVAVQSVRDVLSRYQISSAELAQLQSDFGQLIAADDFVISFKTERLFLYDEIQRCFTEGWLGKGHLYLPRIMELSEMLPILGASDKKGVDKLILYSYAALTHPGAFFTHPDKQETRRQVDRYYDFWEQSFLRTPAQIRAENIDFEKYTANFFVKNVFLELLAPAVERIHQISYRLPTDADAALAIISLLRYKQDTGGYPENLEELVAAGYLEKLSMDSFSDKPLVYKKMEDDFTLYSVGENFKDDDGEFGKDSSGKPKVWGAEGDAVFWPVGK